MNYFLLHISPQAVDLIEDISSSTNIALNVCSYNTITICATVNTLYSSRIFHLNVSVTAAEYAVAVHVNVRICIWQQSS